MNNHLEKYIDSIRHEIEQINEKDFVGNIAFTLNIRYGVIGNMNVVLAKSIKISENLVAQ